MLNVKCDYLFCLLLCLFTYLITTFSFIPCVHKVINFVRLEKWINASASQPHKNTILLPFPCSLLEKEEPLRHSTKVSLWKRGISDNEGKDSLLTFLRDMHVCTQLPSIPLLPQLLPPHKTSSSSTLSQERVGFVYVYVCMYKNKIKKLWHHCHEQLILSTPIKGGQLQHHSQCLWLVQA